MSLIFHFFFLGLQKKKKKLCIWGVNSDTVETIWLKLERACNGGSIFRKIVKVIKVVQSDCTIRFALTLAQDRVALLLGGEYRGRKVERWLASF